jgi:hypothetical protein
MATVAVCTFISQPRLTSIHAHCICQSVIFATTKKLLKIKGFSDTKVDKIKDAAKKLCVSGRPLACQSRADKNSPKPLASLQPQNWLKFARNVLESQLVASN